MGVVLSTSPKENGKEDAGDDCVSSPEKTIDTFISSGEIR
jgi:hypothetical protein